MTQTNDLWCVFAQYDVIYEHFLVCFDQSVLFLVIFSSLPSVLAVAFFSYGAIHSLTAKHIFQTHNLYRSQKCIYAFCSVSAFIDVVVTGSMINSNKDVYYTFGISQQLSIVFIHRNAQNCACMLFLIDSPNTVSQSLGVLCGKYAAKFIKLNVITW